MRPLGHRLATSATTAALALLATSVAVPAQASPRPPGPLAQGYSTPREDPYYPKVGDPGVDVLHYDVDDTWHVSARHLSGTTTLRVRATRSEHLLRLDLSHDLGVRAVHVDGRRVSSRHPGKELVVQAGHLARNSLHTLVVRYAGRPGPYPFPGDRSDITATGWTTQPDGEAWSVQEPYGAFTWFPSNDQPSDKATYDVTLGVDRPHWVGVSGGHLVSDTVRRGVRYTHFHQPAPIASYLVALAYGPYRRHTQTGPHGLPLTYWVRPRDRAVLKVLRRSPQILRYLESRLGRYPFASGGVVVEPNDTGEETATMLSMGSALYRGPRDAASYRSTLAHEYAHQWYGDEVTPDNWRDLWLNETFAMFVQIGYEIHDGIRSEHSWRTTLAEYDSYSRYEDGPPGRPKKDKFADICPYYCGARMLFGLRDVVGRATFRTILRRWPAEHRYGNVHASQWIRYVDRVSGRHLAPVLRDYLYSNDTNDDWQPPGD